MKKIAQSIVRLRKLILTVAVLLLIPSAIGAVATRINYDVLTYLPQELDSMIGEVALEETRAVIHISRISSHAAQNVVGGLHDGAYGGLRLHGEAGQLAFKFRERGSGRLHGRRFIRGGGWFWLRFRFGLGCQFRRTLAGQGPEDALSPGEEGAKQHGKRQGKGLPH